MESRRERCIRGRTRIRRDNTSQGQPRQPHRWRRCGHCPYARPVRKSTSGWCGGGVRLAASCAELLLLLLGRVCKTARPQLPPHAVHLALVREHTSWTDHWTATWARQQSECTALCRGESGVGMAALEVLEHAHVPSAAQRAWITLLQRHVGRMGTPSA